MQVPHIYICLLIILLFDISLAYLVMTYFFLLVLHYSSMLTMMLIGSVSQVLLLLVGVCFLVMRLSLINVKKNMTLSPSHLPRLSIVPYLLLVLRSFGFVILYSLAFPRLNLHHYMLTTLVPSKLVPILSTMNGRSTWRLTIALNRRSLTVRLLPYLISLLLSRSWICSPNP